MKYLLGYFKDGNVTLHLFQQLEGCQLHEITKITDEELCGKVFLYFPKTRTNMSCQIELALSLL